MLPLLVLVLSDCCLNQVNLQCLANDTWKQMQT